jgi:hypothetical protein
LAAIEVAVLFLAVSFGLAYFMSMGHFLGISLATVMVVGWLGGWRIGLAAGFGLPILAAPIPIALGTPSAIVLVDILTFASMSILCGGAVGVMGSLFGEVVSSRRELWRLRGILPICSHCHRIREGNDEWITPEAYIRAHSEHNLSHSICPPCLEEHYTEERGESDD